MPGAGGGKSVSSSKSEEGETVGAAAGLLGMAHVLAKAASQRGRILVRVARFPIP
jgi:hypothetical protein